MTVILLTSGIVIFVIGATLMWKLERMVHQLADDGSFVDESGSPAADEPGAMPLPPHLREEPAPASDAEQCPICGQRHRGRSPLVNRLPFSQISPG